MAPITIDSFRNFETSQNIILSQDGQHLQKAGLLHSIKTTFNSGTARMENARVLDTLKQAIDNDPRYFGIRNQVKGMIDNIRTDKPIRAAQLKNIVSYMDALSTPEQQKACFLSKALTCSISLHQASGGVPQDMAGCSEELRKTYQQSLNRFYQHIADSSTTLGTVDIAAMTQEFDSKITTFVAEVRDTDIPDKYKDKLMQQCLSRDLGLEDSRTALRHYTRICQDALIDDRQKSFALNTVFTKDGIADQQKIDDAVTVRRGFTALEIFKNSPETHTYIENELKKLGLTETETATANILNKLHGKTVMAMQQRQVIDNNFCQTTMDSIIQSYRNAAQEIQTFAPNGLIHDVCIHSLNTIGEPPAATYLTKLHQASLSLPGILDELISAKSVSRIHNLIHSITKAILEQVRQIPEDVKPEMGALKGHAVEHIIGELLTHMTSQQRMELIRNMSSPAVKNLFHFYGENYTSGEAVIMQATIEHIVQQAATMEHIKVDMHSDSADSAALPLSVRTAFSPDSMFTGSLKTGLESRVPADFSAKASHIADSMAQLMFQGEMKKLYLNNPGSISSFAKDIVRNMQVTLPDGQKLPADFNGARDMLAGMVTNGASTSFAQLNAQDKAKVCIFMAIISQEAEKCTQMGTPLLMGNNGIPAYSIGSPTKISGSERVPERSFTLTQDHMGGFTLDYVGNFPLQMLLLDTGKTIEFNVNGSSNAVYELSMHISSEEIDRLSRLDWNNFAAATAFSESDLTAEQLQNSRDWLDAAYCINNEISASFCLDLKQEDVRRTMG